MKILQKLLELDYKEIRSRVDRGSKARSKVLHTELVSASKRGSLRFDTESGTNPGIGLYWKQTVKMLDFIDYYRIPDKELKLLDKVRLATKGDLKVTCNCPAFKYWGWAYISTLNGIKFGQPEKRYPKIRNSKLRGIVCKHLETVLLVLPFQSTSIVKALRNP